MSQEVLDFSHDLVLLVHVFWPTVVLRGCHLRLSHPHCFLRELSELHECGFSLKWIDGVLFVCCLLIFIWCLYVAVSLLFACCCVCVAVSFVYGLLCIAHCVGHCMGTLSPLTNCTFVIKWNIRNWGWNCVLVYHNVALQGILIKTNSTFAIVLPYNLYITG